MLWKCCTQYASKCGKLSSGHRTGKGQFSFQSQRKAMPNNIQTTTRLYSSQKEANKCSQFSKPGFNSTRTKNFQMFKLDLETVEEPEIKLPTSVGPSKKQESLFWTLMLEKTLESPLDCMEIQPVHRKGDQSCVFIGRTDVEAETPILWSPDVNYFKS